MPAGARQGKTSPFCNGSGTMKPSFQLLWVQILLHTPPMKIRAQQKFPTFGTEKGSVRIRQELFNKPAKVCMTNSKGQFTLHTQCAFNLD